jgi:predicted NAD/FAD-dependent oxidoreductase
MRGCWTLMVRYDQPLDLPFDAAFVNRGPLRWVAREPSKPGRPARETAAACLCRLERGAYRGRPG